MHLMTLNENDKKDHHDMKVLPITFLTNVMIFSPRNKIKLSPSFVH